MGELFRAGIWHELIYDDGETQKFWSIKIVNNTHIRKWGVIGTEGKELITECTNSDEARDEAERLYLSKTRKGYKVAQPQLTIDNTDVTHFIRADKLGEFFFEVYGWPFDFYKDMGVGRYTEHVFRPDPENYYIDDVDDFIFTGDVGGITESLLADCVRQRLIPPGVYVVET